MSAGERRLGILAGGGTLPREIADSAQRQGLPVAIVAIDSEADRDLIGPDVTRVNWGGIGGMIRALRQARVTDLVIVGHVHRPELGALKPDLGFFRNLPRLLKIVASGGDDGVLRRVVRFFEQEGFRVIGPGEAAPEVVVREGAAGAVHASDRDRADIDTGLALIRALGPYDIGQGVVIAGGRIEAIEGVEGTDRMIARAAEARRGMQDTPQGGVLVKRSKPEQDLRVDMPAIGPATVDRARAAGLSGIAVEAEHVLIAERTVTLQRADAAGLFVEGVRDKAAVGAAPRRFKAHRVVRDLRPLGGAKPRRHSVRDAVKGLATVEALARFGVGHTAVVVRNHVLAVEADEGAEATVRRAEGLRQWASLTRRRRGVVVLRRAGALTEALVALVARAGYAGIAIGDDAVAASGSALAAAEREGLFVVTSPPQGDAP
ncbi:MAG TPA: UDP-2,3-diacylglucosamine diphosphatase LpxI [Hyphomicrobium sp.]|nr:UDP-2,3-diacylglucosamine diphosphatase LpxI [Hyphomicrobium sp.]